MLLSFKKHFGDEMDYVYFTDVDEPNLDKIEDICQQYGIRLIVGSCKKHYEEYRDIEYIGRDRKPRWPDAHYWYCEAPKYLHTEYQHAIKCDGDMMCSKHFDLEPLESECAVTVAKEPEWYTPYDKHCPNAGFQIFNLAQYVSDRVYEYFREGARKYQTFNSDTPVLDFLVGNKMLNVKFVGPEFNYLLFDTAQVRNLALSDVANVSIFHFVDTKPHNLSREMHGTIKDHLGQIYLSL